MSFDRSKTPMTQVRGAVRGTAQLVVPVLIGVVSVWTLAVVLAKDDASLALNSGAAPWPLPDRASERIVAAGLKPYRDSGPLSHPHAHLDIFIDGRSVPVPANLGLASPFASLHTHSDSGILHMESADSRATFTLGDLFTIWGVRLTDSCIGSYCSPTVSRVYVNGKEQNLSISKVQLEPLSEIAIVIGRSPDRIPESYDCHNAAEIERVSCRGFLDRH